MKKCKKNCLLVSCFLCLCNLFVFSQNNEQTEESIILPDVSTVISGGAIKAGKSSVPDYSLILPEASNEPQIIPQLPDTDNLESNTEKAEVLLEVKEKDVYAEGLTGCGMPGYFIGNFSIYRESGNNPFKISFMHEATSGYAGNSLTSGYFDRNTQVMAEKTFSTDSMKFHFDVAYKTIANGLQNKAENINDVTKETILLGVDYDFNLPHGMFLGTNIDGSWYKRYASVVGQSIIPIDEYKKNVSIIDFIPSLKFGWQNEHFYTSLSGTYTLFSNINNSFKNNPTLNRGNFDLNAGYKNDIINVYTKVSAVVGNNIGNNSVIVPFNLGVDFSFPIKISPYKMNLSFSGGLDSYCQNVNVLEQKYLFTSLDSITKESSDWFGRIYLGLPIKSAFTVNLEGVYKTSAFNNGTYVPLYNNDVVNFGQYDFIQKELTQLNTNLCLSFKVGIATFSAIWQSCWLDVKPKEYENFVSALFAVQDNGSRFGVDGSLGIALDKEEDVTPVINMSGFFRMTQAVRLAISFEDMIKLFSGKSRKYAGNYIDSSGNVSLLVKFFF